MLSAIAAGGMIVGFGLGWLGPGLPTGPYLSLGRGHTTMLSWVVVNLRLPSPAIISAYPRCKPVWWATYIAFSGFGLATALSGDRMRLVLLFFWQYLVFAGIAAVVVQWGRHSSLPCSNDGAGTGVGQST